MRPLSIVTGRVLPIARADIDTDQIIPARYLKRIERSGYGEFAFAAWRTDPTFPLADPRRAGACILVAGPNFGCGSSREHAAWALEDLGIRVVVAPSFADIFRSNCAQVGLLTVTLPRARVERLLALSIAEPEVELTVDLIAQTLTGPEMTWSFEVDPAVKHNLVHGLDAIAHTLQFADEIDAFEARQSSLHPHTKGLLS